MISGDMARISVSSVCHVQSAEDRFPSSHQEVKAFVYEEQHIPSMVDEDDFDEDEDDEVDPEDYDEMTDGIYVPGAPFGGNEDGESVNGDADDGQTFPHPARARMNLTALSQEYNVDCSPQLSDWLRSANFLHQLYFAAYQDQIHVFKPQAAPQILPPPSLVLQCKPTKSARYATGAISPLLAHQINQIKVGYLGELEILLFNYDDGDVAAYYVRHIADHINSRDGRPPHVAPWPKPCFHESVAMSAWGLAIHQQSRLIAVGSNNQEATVFAFATSYDLDTDPVSSRHQLQVDSCVRTWKAEESAELERHVRSRSRTWRIILPYGPGGYNVPSLSFCSDAAGEAEKLVTVDIHGNTWIFDIWKVGSSPVRIAPALSRVVQRRMGWSVLVLPDSSFRRTDGLQETFGLPAREMIHQAFQPVQVLDGEANRPDPSGLTNWLDITGSLYYVKDVAPDMDAQLRQRLGPAYHRRHHATNPDKAGSEESDPEPEDGIENADGPLPGSNDEATSGLPASTSDANLIGSAVVRFARTITPSLNKTTGWDPVRYLPPLYVGVPSRQSQVPVSLLSQAELPSYMSQIGILVTRMPDIELQILDSQAASVVCKEVLGNCNYHNRRNSPWDMEAAFSDRISMLLHVPELNLVVAGALNGRVALITLTKTRKRLGGLSIRRGFRVDWVLPRKEEEEKRLRPWCTLHGVAISPLPEPHGKGLQLFEPGKPRNPRWYRLILHYLDHTILMCRLFPALPGLIMEMADLLPNEQTMSPDRKTKS